MKQQGNYGKPELRVIDLDQEDIITGSSADNFGYIPGGWSEGTEEVGFDA